MSEEPKMEMIGIAPDSARDWAWNVRHTTDALLEQEFSREEAVRIVCAWQMRAPGLDFDQMSRLIDRVQLMMIDRDQ